MGADGRPTMQIPTPTGVALLTRGAWRRLLARQVRCAEVEPPVRRRQRRYRTPFGTWHLLYHRAGKPARIRVRLMDAAPDGLMLLLLRQAPVATGLPVLLTLDTDEGENAVLMGVVMHCTSTVGGYKVGVRLQLPP